MVTYSIGSRGWRCAGLFVLAVPAYLSIAHLVWLIRHGEPSSNRLGIIVFALMFLWVISRVARRIVEIRIAGNGVISFVRTIGRIDVATTRIVRLVGEFVSGHEGPEWTMRIDLTRGHSIRLEGFSEVRDFADRVEALNPQIEIWGMWPMGAPEPRPKAASGFVQAVRR